MPKRSRKASPNWSTTSKVRNSGGAGLHFLALSFALLLPHIFNDRDEAPRPWPGVSAITIRRNSAMESPHNCRNCGIRPRVVSPKSALHNVSRTFAVSWTFVAPNWLRTPFSAWFCRLDTSYFSRFRTARHYYSLRRRATCAHNQRRDDHQQLAQATQRRHL